MYISLLVFVLLFETTKRFHSILFSFSVWKLKKARFKNSGKETINLLQQLCFTDFNGQDYIRQNNLLC